MPQRLESGKYKAEREIFMKFYSEKTKKYYDEDKLDLLKADEAKFDEENKKQEVIKAERAERAKAVEDAFKKAEQAQKEANKLLNDFIKDYKSFHLTIKDDHIPTVPTSSLFDLVFDPFQNLFFR